jgi:hypothetical protein
MPDVEMPGSAAAAANEAAAAAAAAEDAAQQRQVVGGVVSSELAAEALAAVAAAAAEPLSKQLAHRAALVRCVHQAGTCRAGWSAAVCDGQAVGVSAESCDSSVDEGVCECVYMSAESC